MFLELDNLINCLSLKLESINNLFLTKKFDEIYQQVILEQYLKNLFEKLVLTNINLIT